MYFYDSLYFMKNNELTASNIFPEELLNQSQTKIYQNKVTKIAVGRVYSLNDFQNEIGVIVPYWKDTISSYNVQVKEMPYYDDDIFEDDEVVNRFNDEVYGSLSAQTTNTSSLNLQKENNNESFGDDGDTATVDNENLIVPHLGPCYLPNCLLTELTRQITPPTKNTHVPPPIESRRALNLSILTMSGPDKFSCVESN